MQVANWIMKRFLRNLCLIEGKMENYVLVILGVISFLIHTNSGLNENDITLENFERTNLTSPNYPSPYENNADILWRVIAPPDFRMALHFTDMNTEQDHDYVTVYEGRTPHFKEAVQRIHLSGHTRPVNITSIGSYLWIRFTSDVDGTYKGFRAIVSCTDIREVVLTVADTANITSPNFPHPYDNNADILWKVASPAGYRVVLHFTDFNIERFGDNVTVYEGRVPDFEQSVMRIHESGKILPSNITSVGSYLWLRFTSNRHSPYTMNTGFNARLLSIAIRVINLTLMETANLTSPNYPHPYDDSTDILWKVIAPSGYRAKVTFSAFNTENTYDFVIIFEGRMADFEESTEREKLSGNPRLGQYSSIGSYLWLRFISDGLNFDSYTMYTGFSVRLSCVKIRDIQLEDGKTIEVTSPNYPDEYDKYADMLWKVTAPASNRVVVHITHLDTEPGYDFVTIYDGRVPNFETSVERMNVSGHGSTYDTTSIGSYLWVRFTSDRRNPYDSGITYTGFRAELYYVPIRDILLTTGKTSNLTSPHYPSLYDSNTDIVWKVIAPAGYRVMVGFSVFDTMPDYDFVTIFEGLTTDFEEAVERAKLSGNTLPYNITSIGSYVWLRFTSGDESESCTSCSGFMALMSTVQGPESKSPTASVIHTTVSYATPRTVQKEDTNDAVDIHSTVAASIGSSLTILLIGLIFTAVFMCHRRRSQSFKIVGSSSANDDSIDHMYRNPFYGTNDHPPDNIISPNTPSASRSPSELHQGLPLNASVFEEHREQDTSTQMPRTDFDAGDFTYCSIDDLPDSEKPTSLRPTDLPNVYEECAEEDILDHKPLTNNSACHVVTTQGAISCIRDKAASEMRHVTDDGYEECIVASNKNKSTYSAETAGDINDVTESRNSPYFTLEKQSRCDTGNDKLNDFDIYHEISLNGSAGAEGPLDHKVSSDIKLDSQCLGINKQASSTLSARTASLCHEKEYNSLDFMKSCSLSRHISTENVDETKERNTYDVLNVKKDPYPGNPLSTTIHGDNMYNTLSKLHPDP